MAEVPLGTGIHYFADPTKGKPVYFGSVYVGAADLNPKILANRVSVILLQENGTKVTLAPSAQPFVTGAGGQILYQGSVSVIKVTDTVSVRVDNQAGYQVNYNPRYNETDSLTASLNEGAKPTNGSFEIELGTGVAANWLINATNGSVVVDSTESAHGLKSLKFTGIDPSGGGTATSDLFNIAENEDIDVRFIYRSTAANTLNEVKVQYFNSAGAPVSIDTIYSNSTTNPIIYTSYIVRSTVPATAVQANILLIGVSSSGATTTASTYFDGLSFDYISQNAVVRTQGTLNAVSRIVVKDNSTGNKPSIDVEGENVGLDVEGVELYNNDITAEDITATNSITSLNDITSTAGDITAGGSVIADAITANTVNSDVDLQRNGTGDITIDSVPIYGMVILDTPETLLIAAAPTAVWTAHDSATLGTAGAKKAILRITVLSAVGVASAYLRKTGTALSANDSTLSVISTNQDTGNTVTSKGSSDTIVNLDANSDFDWQMPATTGSISIYLIGYYT